MTRSLLVRRETFPVRGVFRISRGDRTIAETIVVELYENGARGRGECIAYPRYGHTVSSVLAQIETAKVPLENGLDREGLATLLPPGPARNILDCALWDLSAKTHGKPVWSLAGLPEPEPMITAYTLSIDSPQAMAVAAAENRFRPLLKLKLAGDGLDLERVTAIRDRAPDSRLIVDANEAWDIREYETMVISLQELAVEMIEQPFPEDQDAALADLPRPIPICADESVHDSATLERLAGRYDLVNIKLLKAGGLTEAIKVKQQALALGFELMIGTMLSSSLAVAPALLLAQGARYLDADGPLLLAEDRSSGLHYEGSLVYPPASELWG